MNSENICCEARARELETAEQLDTASAHLVGGQSLLPVAEDEEAPGQVCSNWSRAKGEVGPYVFGESP